MISPVCLQLLLESLTQADTKTRWHNETYHAGQVYDNPVLGMWAWKVRKDYRNNKLAQWKIDKLEGLEFLWKVDQVTSKWHTNLHECRRYKVGPF